MADTAEHLVDHVLPHAPVRQWVLSFPFRIRFLLASSPRLCAAVRGIVTRTLLGWLEQRALAAAAAERSARSRSTESARSGAVIFAQRFGSALNLNLHFRAFVLDGAFASPSERLEHALHHRQRPPGDPTGYPLGRRARRRENPSKCS
jgi:hypothetical protein